MKRKYIIQAVGVLVFVSCTRRTIYISNDELPTGTQVVCIPLTHTLRNASLTEVTDGKKIPLACQVARDSLYFKVKQSQQDPLVRKFEVSKSKVNSQEPTMKATDDGESITLSSGNRNILSYHYAIQQVPKGVRNIFARSGFIHPAHTPSGFTLTRILAEDHRHHYGIWNPWTHVEYKGKLYDLWNLGDSLGTVRAKSVDKVYQGEVMAGVDASLEHVAFTPDEGEVKLMDEQWLIRAYETEDGFLWDFESHLTPCTAEPVIIRAYRYQGFSIRANEYWTRENSHMMTSEGKERPQIDGSHARWIYTQGDTGNATQGGFLFMASPENQNAPEPLRIWNEEANGGRGDVFVNFCPAKNEDIILQPYQTYVFRYRVLTYDGTMNAWKAERLWQSYIHRR